MTTMPVLPPYTADQATCSKCGCGPHSDEKIDTHFGSVPTPEELQPSPLVRLFIGGEEAANQKLPAILADLPAGQEFLARGCGRCHYVWLEACIDDPNIAMGRELS
jgi:hypothetical protein